jgi:hypothetical protein
MDYISLIKTFASDTQGGALLILAVAAFACIQYLLNKHQTKTLGGNHIEHLRTDIREMITGHETNLKETIRLHEQREFEHDKDVLVVLGRIERAIIEQGSRRK